jgi:hypothetical protein
MRVRRVMRVRRRTHWGLRPRPRLINISFGLPFFLLRYVFGCGCWESRGGAGFIYDYIHIHTHTHTCIRIHIYPVEIDVVIQKVLHDFNPQERDFKS